MAKGQPIYHDKLGVKKRHLEECYLRSYQVLFQQGNTVYIYIHSSSNYSTNITYNDKHMQITKTVAMIWKSPAPPLIEYNFEGIGLILTSSHLIETLHCPFSSNKNEDAAASSFCFDFCGCGLSAPILARSWQRYWSLHNSSWLGAPILAKRWQHYWYPIKHRKHL